VIRSLLPAENDPEVEVEMAEDRRQFDAEGLNPEVHRRTVRAGLAVRRWIEQEKLTAFTMNFLDIDQASGLPTVPFLEASKAMARGVGYAGEGDVLTAAFVGALMSGYPDTSFTEMFCPDWEGNSIFLSHMGEWNLNLAAEKPRLMEKPFPWTDAENPVVAVGRFRPGEASLFNLAPMEHGFALILAPIAMLDVDGEDRMSDSVHGWFRPQIPISDFLESYSSYYPCGTHHLAVAYGEETRSFTRGVESLMGIGGVFEIGFHELATLGDLQELRRELGENPKRRLV
jgi:L-arabinose isomerase